MKQKLVDLLQAELYMLFGQVIDRVWMDEDTQIIVSVNIKAKAEQFDEVDEFIFNKQMNESAYITEFLDIVIC